MELWISGLVPWLSEKLSSFGGAWILVPPWKNSSCSVMHNQWYMNCFCWAVNSKKHSGHNCCIKLVSILGLSFWMVYCEVLNQFKKMFWHWFVKLFKLHQKIWKVEESSFGFPETNVKQISVSNFKSWTSLAEQIEHWWNIPDSEKV